MVLMALFSVAVLVNALFLCPKLTHGFVYQAANLRVLTVSDGHKHLKRESTQYNQHSYRVADPRARLFSRGHPSEEDRPRGADPGDHALSDRQCHDFRRRKVLSRILQSATALAVTGTALPRESQGGEVGARITSAVTQSDLGISVRRSVVQGAQLIDKLDGRWEKFSDNFGLGAERSKREGRPKPREVPDLLPLDGAAATSMLKAADEAFLSVVPIGEQVLQRQIASVDGLVRKSFERSGVSLDEVAMNADTFNFLSYLHFKAYNDILVERQVNFNQFRKKFEPELGGKLLSILDPTYLSREDDKIENGAESLRLKLVIALESVDKLTSSLRSKGMVALVERSELDDDNVADWSEDLADLQFSIALDKDATQNSQILLQEQGFRLYPDFARFAITTALRRVLSPMKQDITTEEYYMDTSYSSDPDQFEVKQVLLNIVIEGA